MLKPFRRLLNLVLVAGVVGLLVIVAGLFAQAPCCGTPQSMGERLVLLATLQTGLATLLMGHRLAPGWRCLVYAAPVVPVAVIAASLASSGLGLAALEGQTWPLVLYGVSLGNYYSFVLPGGPASGEGRGIHRPE